MKRLPFQLLVGLFAFYLLILPLASCVKDSQQDTNDFTIYLVADVDQLSLDSLYSLEQSNILDLKLENEPWLTLKDIDYYDISTHYIYLKDKVFTLDVDVKKSFVKPFVVVAGGERCYLGYFLSSASSWLPLGTYVSYPTFLADDIIAIKNNLLNGEIDERNDPRIKEALTKAGKLNPGLRISLNNAKVISRLEVVTMGYSFTIANGGDSPLYVPDPDKMGGNLFHYYTNGLLMTSVENPHESVWASKKPRITLEPITKWDINWFTRLGSHESMDRTVTLSGYPDLNIGLYKGFLTSTSRVKTLSFR
ncbi:hypothetical protein ES703_125786 [subsurface metagenome]